jgi:transposase
MSGYRSSPKFEMIASTRRRWTDGQKREIVAEIDAPNGSVSKVARRYSLHTSLLFRWRRDFTAPRSESAPSHLTAPTFVPIALTSPLPTPPASAVAVPPASTPIEILLADGRSVRTASNIDPQALARIVAALEALR